MVKKKRFLCVNYETCEESINLCVKYLWHIVEECFQEQSKPTNAKEKTSIRVDGKVALQNRKRIAKAHCYLSERFLEYFTEYATKVSCISPRLPKNSTATLLSCFMN